MCCVCPTPIGAACAPALGRAAHAASVPLAPADRLRACLVAAQLPSLVDPALAWVESEGKALWAEVAARAGAARRAPPRAGGKAPIKMAPIKMALIKMAPK